MPNRVILLRNYWACAGLRSQNFFFSSLYCCIASKFLTNQKGAFITGFKAELFRTSLATQHGRITLPSSFCPLRRDTYVLDDDHHHVILTHRRLKSPAWKQTSRNWSPAPRYGAASVGVLNRFGIATTAWRVAKQGGRQMMFKWATTRRPKNSRASMPPGVQTTLHIAGIQQDSP